MMIAAIARNLQTLSKERRTDGLITEPGSLTDPQPEIRFSALAEGDFAVANELASRRSGLRLLQIRTNSPGRADELVVDSTRPGTVENRWEKRIDNLTNEFECSIVDAI
jgi:hypothetical protein